MPGANDYHGWLVLTFYYLIAIILNKKSQLNPYSPFKHFERNFLHQKLKQYGRTEEETKEVKYTKS